MLTAGTARAADLDAEVIGLDLDIDFLSLWQNRDGDCGGVHATLSFGRRHALHAVNAGFVFHESKDSFAGDFQNHFLESTHLRRATFEVLAFPSAKVGIALVGAHQLGSEQ